MQTPSHIRNTQEFRKESPFPVFKQEIYDSLPGPQSWPPTETELEEFLLRFTYMACHHHDPKAWKHAINDKITDCGITNIVDEIDFSECHSVEGKIQTLWRHFQSWIPEVLPRLRHPLTRADLPHLPLNHSFSHGLFLGEYWSAALRSWAFAIDFLSAIAAAELRPIFLNRIIGTIEPSNRPLGIRLVREVQAAGAVIIP